MNIEQGVSLSDKNWFRTGGLAAWYAEPTCADTFARALAFSQERGLDLFVLGSGANVLISDTGFDGLVLRPRLQKIAIDAASSTLTAGAGVDMGVLIDYALDKGLSGLEEFSGIPGTVGGSVYINIHYFEFLLSDFLVRAQVINRYSGEVISVEHDWFQFGYNQSTLQSGEWLLLEATFKLKGITPLEAAYARGRRDEIARHRSKRYPTARTCGSFFRNFLPNELPFSVNGKKLPFVAYYLDKVGVKGTLKIGAAAVSHLHANMLVTEEGATTSDVIAVVRRMQELVRNEFGIIPQPECRLIGFDQYPLL